LFKKTFYLLFNMVRIHQIFPKTPVSLLLLFFLLAGANVIAQESGDWQITARLFTARSTVKDQVFSQLMYSGWSPGGGAALRFEKGKSLHEWEIAFAKGTLKQDNNQAQQTYITGDYTYLHGLNNGSNLNVMAGGSLNILYARRNYDGFINYSVSNELIASLGPAGLISFSFYNGFSVCNRLQIPLVSMVMQPSIYDENPPGKTGSGLSDFLKSNRFATFGRFLRIKNNLTMEKEIGPGQSLAFTYSWDYYQIRSKPDIQQASHLLGFIYRYTF
jgi:hypothetical protein